MAKNEKLSPEKRHGVSLHYVYTRFHLKYIIKFIYCHLTKPNWLNSKSCLRFTMTKRIYFWFTMIALLYVKKNCITFLDRLALREVNMFIHERTTLSTALIYVGNRQINWKKLFLLPESLRVKATPKSCVHVPIINWTFHKQLHMNQIIMGLENSPNNYLDRQSFHIIWFPSSPIEYKSYSTIAWRLWLCFYDMVYSTELIFAQKCVIC